ncbi:GTPase Era, mitochondrial-like [Gigantopelta aegis]|uniref:GTPase Era, mitochondrial-like n=1 Tax=Gigantopelta aegis TaxID=1735272 RepID=UPI001B8877B9|nr:GTPase Era, mitochondrial-like [Gigantopelta aegis]
MAASMRNILCCLKNSSSVYCSRSQAIFNKKTQLTWCQYQVFKIQVQQYGQSNREEETCHHGDFAVQRSADNSKSDVKHPQDFQFSQDNIAYERAVGKSEAEQQRRAVLTPDQPPEPKLLRVAIIGTPNAGKSTLTNQLMRWKVSSVSPKVHTTRHNVRAVFTEDDTQIVFMDTPGLLHPKQRKKHHLEMTLVTDPERSLESADLIAVLHDISNTWTRNQLDPLVLQILHLYPQLPSILILNKVDLLKKKSLLLQITRNLTEGVVGGEMAGAHTKKTSRRKQHIDEFLNKYDQQDSPDYEDSHSEEMHHRIDKVEQSHCEQLHHGIDKISEDSETEKCFNDEFSRRHLIPIAYKKKVKADGQTEGQGQGSWTEYHDKRKEIQFKIRNKNGWPNFSHVFMVSALTGDGVDELRSHLKSRAVRSDWEYHSSLVTDQDPFELACTYVWEKILEHLPRQIPYHLYPEIVLWEVDEEGVLNILMDITTKDQFYFFQLLGHKGKTITKIAEEAKQELMNAFRCEMRLRLEAKLRNKS